MQSSLSIAFLSLAFSIMLLSPHTRAEVRFVPADTEENRLQVVGTSNVRDWEVNTDDIQGELTLKQQGFPGREGLAPADVPASPEAGLSFFVEIPAASVKSDNQRFNNNLHSYMDVKNHETIRFVFQSLTHEYGDEPPTGPQEVKTAVTGELTLAGVTKPLTFPVTWSRRDRQLVLNGSAEFKMSLFGISPPRMMMGALRTADAVSVRFTWILDLAETEGDIPPASEPESIP